MRCTVFLLALGLLAGSALADLAPPTCGAGGMGGGWTPVSGSDVPQEVVDAVVNTVMSSVVGNLTAQLRELGDIGQEDLKMGPVSVAGCQQVVQGTNYKLWLNLTATAGTSNITLGLSADVFNPLPANNGGNGQAPTVYDIDAEFVSINGLIVTKASSDADDKWDVDSDGNVMANGNFTDGTWNAGVLAGDVDDLLQAKNVEIEGSFTTNGGMSITIGSGDEKKDD